MRKRPLLIASPVSTDSPVLRSKKNAVRAFEQALRSILRQDDEIEQCDIPDDSYGPQTVHQGVETSPDNYFILSCTDRDKPDVKCHVIESLDGVVGMLSSDPVFSSSETEYVALDAEGVPDDLLLLQIATPSIIYILDCHVMVPQNVCDILREPLWESDRLVKLFHDLRNDAQALNWHGSVSSLRGVVDTQLVAHFLWNNRQDDVLSFQPWIGLNGLLERLALPTHPSKHLIQELDHMDQGCNFWTRRPIPKEYLEYAAFDVHLLLQTVSPLEDLLASQRSSLDHFIDPSLERAADAISKFRWQQSL